MKKHVKRISTILVAALFIIFAVLLFMYKHDFNLGNSLYNIAFWVVIPVGSVIIGSQYLNKHLWITLVAVFVLDIALWLISFNRIPFDDGYIMGMALLSAALQELGVLAIVAGIYIVRHIKKRMAKL